MMKFTILVIASILAPGFAAIAQTRPALVDMATLPGVIDLAEPVPRPQPVPEAQPLPESVEVNPCNACFEYMTSLIDQLTVGGVNPALPELPTVTDPEDEVEGNTPIRPLPEGLPEDLRPLPVPENPEIEINPIPSPVAPETGIRPLPLPVAPGVGIQPIPLPIVQVIRPAF